MATFWKPPTKKERKELEKRINFATVRMNNEDALIMLNLGHLENVEKLSENAKECLMSNEPERD